MRHVPPRSYGRISRELLAQLELVPPSHDYERPYRPSRVQMSDGQLVDRVYVQEAGPWFGHWGVWPEDDRHKASLRIEDVTQIEDSPTRLPPAIADEIYTAGENHMGGVDFTVLLRGGRRLSYLTGNAVDFVSWPAGVTPQDVVGVVPHARDGEPVPDRLEPGFWWCLYSL